MSVAAALALLASGTPVITERWWFLFADDRRAWYADVLTATRSDGTTDLTYQMVHRVPRGRVMCEVIRTNINCPQRRSRVVAIDAFDIMDRHVKASQLDDPPGNTSFPTAPRRRFGCTPAAGPTPGRNWAPALCSGNRCG